MSTSVVRIYAFAEPDLLRGLRAATWTGSVDWPGAPRRGDTWFHCDDWGGVAFDRLSFQAPRQAGEAGFIVEVRVPVDELAHLVDVHGFSGTFAG